MTRLRLAIAGCGRVFERCHAPALSRSADWEVCAVCDPSEERRRRAARAFPRSAVFESLERLLETSRADALIVATPHALHAPIARIGLDAGLHVLVEKPMATTAAEARALVDAAARSGKCLTVGFNRRFRKPYRAIRAGVERAAAAAHHGASFELITDGVRWGLAPDPMEILLDVTSHAVDLVPWILGRSIRRVRVSLRSLRSGEIRADLEADLGDGVRAACSTGTGMRHRESLRVRLERGELRAPGRAGELARSVTRRALRRPSLTIESFIEEHAAFAEAARGGRSRIASGLDGLRAALAVEACAESLAAGGGWVDVPEVGGEEEGEKTGRGRGSGRGSGEEDGNGREP